MEDIFSQNDEIGTTRELARIRDRDTEEVNTKTCFFIIDDASNRLRVTILNNRLRPSILLSLSIWSRDGQWHWDLMRFRVGGCESRDFESNER